MTRTLTRIAVALATITVATTAFAQEPTTTLDAPVEIERGQSLLAGAAGISANNATGFFLEYQRELDHRTALVLRSTVATAETSSDSTGMDRIGLSVGIDWSFGQRQPTSRFYGVPHFGARLELPNEDYAIPGGIRCDVRFVPQT